MIYFNEIDRFAADWLGNLFPGAVIDTRSIKDVKAGDVVGYGRCHFFGGIGGWEYALRLAGWPEDESVWTGSCPCQPFSVAGKRKAQNDERHLWPEFLRLIAECKPATIFGEQVASKLGREWLSGVRTDLEALGYEVGAADLCAAGVGSPHIRQRLFWVGHADSPSSSRLGRLGVSLESKQETDRSSDSVNWKRYEAIRCSDGKTRRIEPKVFPLANGVPREMGRGQPELGKLVKGARGNRVGRLKGYGNAIVPQVAAEFIKAFMETRSSQ